MDALNMHHLFTGHAYLHTNRDANERLGLICTQSSTRIKKKTSVKFHCTRTLLLKCTAFQTATETQDKLQ